MADGKVKAGYPAGQGAELAGLIGYQAGSIVSREIISQAAGTVTVFAFDGDQGLSEHTAPFDAMVYVLEGAAEVSINHQPQRVGQGEFIIMPAHQPHALKALERFKMLLIMIKEVKS